MATYLELYGLHSDSTLIQKVSIAIAIAAEAIRAEDPATADHAARMVWAGIALRNVDGMARHMMWVLLAQYEGNTLAQIQGATDAQILAAVESAITIFY